MQQVKERMQLEARNNKSKLDKEIALKEIH